MGRPAHRPHRPGRAEIATKLLDVYLARTGVSSQQTDQDTPRCGPNLWEPSDEDADRGAHGDFDERAHDHDPVLWAATHRGQVVGGLVAAGAAGAVAAARRLAGSRQH